MYPTAVPDTSTHHLVQKERLFPLDDTCFRNFHRCRTGRLQGRCSQVFPYLPTYLSRHRRPVTAAGGASSLLHHFRGTLSTFALFLRAVCWRCRSRHTLCIQRQRGRCAWWWRLTTGIHRLGSSSRVVGAIPVLSRIAFTTLVG